MAKKLWQNWHKLGREITSEAAVIRGNSEYVHLGKDDLYVTIVQKNLDESVPVEINSSVLHEEFTEEGVVSCDNLDIKKVFQWLPSSSSNLPDWMHSVHIDDGGIYVTNNEIVVRYDFPWQKDTVGFTIPPEVVLVVKKTSSLVNGFRCDVRECGDKSVTFRFNDNSFLTYKLPLDERFPFFGAFVRSCHETSSISADVVSDIVTCLREVPYAVAIDPVPCAIVELQRDLFDTKVLYQNDCFQSEKGSYEGKSFKKVFKAMSVGKECYFETGAQDGAPAAFSFIGKDGYKVEGILGVLNA